MGTGHLLVDDRPRGSVQARISVQVRIRVRRVIKAQAVMAVATIFNWIDAPSGMVTV